MGRFQRGSARPLFCQIRPVPLPIDNAASCRWRLSSSSGGRILRSMKRLPALFLSHGSPTLATDDSATGRFLDRLGESLPRPRAILVASAHYLTGKPQLGAAPAPRTHHDFGGFPAPLYDIQYPAPGDPAMSMLAAYLLNKSGIAASTDPE